MKELHDIIAEHGIRKLYFHVSPKEEGAEEIERCWDVTESAITMKVKAENELHLYVMEKVKPKELFLNLANLEMLEEVYFNEAIDFSNVKNLSYMFLSCKALEKVDFGKTKFTNLEKINYMFNDCESLKQIKGLDFNCPNLTSAKDCFKNCISLEELDFSNANLKSLNTAEDMFNNCKKFKHLDLSNANTLALTDAESMFCDCNDLLTVKLKEVDNITNTRGMFKGCYSLEEIDFGNTFKKLRHAASMFADCYSLKNIDLKMFEGNILEEISNMFFNCKQLEGEIVFPKLSLEVTTISYVFSGCEKITKIDMRNVSAKKTDYFYGFAKDCKSLKSIELFPVSVNTLVLDEFVMNCSELIYLSLENIEVERTIDTQKMAADCRKLKVARFGFGLHQIKTGNEIFLNCRQLRLIQSLKGVQERNFKYGKFMFLGCEELKALNIAGVNFNEYISSNTDFEDNMKLVYTSEENREYHKDKYDKGETIFRRV